MNWLDLLFGPGGFFGQTPPILQGAPPESDPGMSDGTHGTGTMPGPILGQGGSDPGGGGILPVVHKSDCRPAFHPLGDNTDWLIYHGIEVGLVVVLLIGILAVLFGNSQADVSIAEVAAA